MPTQSAEDAQPGATYSSVAFGLWMLVAGAAASAFLARQGGWPFVFPAVATVLGALLVWEAWWSRPRMSERDESALGLVTPHTTAASAWLIPIWLHLLLLIAGSVAGFFSSALVGACTFIAIVWAATKGAPAWLIVKNDSWRGIFTIAVALPCFFGGAVFGLHHSRRLILRYLPARCPQCGQRSFCHPGRPISYHCCSCGHVAQTIVNEGR